MYKGIFGAIEKNLFWGTRLCLLLKIDFLLKNLKRL